MIQDIGTGRLDNQYKNVKARPEDTAIVFQGTCKRDDSILAKIEWNSGVADRAWLPTVGEVCECGYTADDFIYLFAIDDRRFFLLDRYSDSIEGIAKLTEEEAGYEFAGTRTLTKTNPMELGLAAITAYHLFDWYRINQFCGRCGGKMMHDDKERAKRCTCGCGNMVFPKICPACIIAVRNGDTVITSRYAGRAYRGRALLAGFCEIGETAEETVIREVMEEVGLKVKNVTYYASQPWGVESDLLLGFYCDVDGSTEVHIDEDELAIAEWTPREVLLEELVDADCRTLTQTMLVAFANGEI